MDIQTTYYHVAYNNYHSETNRHQINFGYRFYKVCLKRWFINCMYIFKSSRDILCYYCNEKRNMIRVIDWKS